MKILYQLKSKRRKDKVLNKEERHLVHKIKRRTDEGNLDNISRTVSYQKFYQVHPEIKWSFLASMVSRNAGWNMTDLKGEWFPRVMSKTYRKQLFFTYERANWLIFSDAYPQLLLYEESKRRGEPLFHLLDAFGVSVYMEIAWMRFWLKPNEERLWTELIINEQNVIQQPVIEHPFYKKKVFHSIPFRLQDGLHFNTVIFPTLNKEMYGFSVHDFRNLEERILLGRRLAWLLFRSKQAGAIHRFAYEVDHTGSRFDYEKFFGDKRNTPFLRMAYPVIDHDRGDLKDWYRKYRNTQKYFSPLLIPEYEVTSWYKKKQKQLQAGVLLKELLLSNEKEGN